jgi:hypothetical protein
LAAAYSPRASRWTCSKKINHPLKKASQNKVGCEQVGGNQEFQKYFHCQVLHSSFSIIHSPLQLKASSGITLAVLLLTKKIMKNLLLLIACAFISALVVSAQQNWPGSDTFRVGVQTIHIPWPEGFVNGYPRLPELAGHMKALGDPESRILTVHLTREIAAKIEKGERVERLDFYATISVQKAINDIDVTPAMFAEFTSSLQRDFETAVDANLPTAVEAARKALSERWGRPADIGMVRPVNLGFFDKQPNLSSVMMLSPILIDGKQIPMLSVMSHVVVNKRLLYISIFKELTVDGDAVALRDFTKKWTAAIIAANK